MISSYFKTAKRVITRNGVFSTINIIGLAASMSVGLLFITILADVFRYDRFHEKKDRIVRVITDYRDSQNQVKLATSSIAIAQEIRDHVPEAEQTTTLGHGFNGDFGFDDKIQPLKGYWAQPSFFEVFSFPLLYGDPATALKGANSIVITESTALRIFGSTDVLGKNLTRNDSGADKNPEFIITGVMKDVPKFSHIKFEALGSSVTNEINNPSLNDWGNIWSNYTYVVMREGVSTQQIQSALDRITEKRSQNSSDNQQSILFGLQPPTDIVFFGGRLDNQAGPVMPTRFLWLISGLSLIVLITACFNYTNLSVARASTRMREVGIRKVIGAKRSQVMFQFMTESTVIALLSLIFALGIFTLIKSQFLSLTPSLTQLFDFTLTPVHVIIFVVFAITTGLLSGTVPGLFFSKANAAHVLRGSGGWKGSSRTGIRKLLIVVQYVFALAFITSTVILYKQYSDFVTFDLGFNTNNTININLQGNDADVLESKLAGLPEVQETSGSLMVTSTGNNFYTHVKGIDPNDSLRAWYNKIDEAYLDLFDFKLAAGRNITGRSEGAPEREVIVNRTLINQLNIAGGDPDAAVGQTVTIDGNELTIAGVVEDFHYSTLDRKIGPFVFRQLDKPRILNVRVASNDLPATMLKIESVWRTVDDRHPLDAEFYDQQIEHAYREYSSIGKVVGFLAFLTVVICSLGLLGMVIFSAETRKKEMSIRRVMGAHVWNVTFLLSKNFLLLLSLSAIIAIPSTWVFFTKVVLANVVYHNPIGFAELFVGALAVAAIALGLVITQSLRVARKNPAEVLRSE
jgi:ABC-type antimicrobial peptide transport system permease subunit